MRKVKNQTNQAALDKLGKYFVSPLLDVLVQAKTQSCQVHHLKATAGLAATQLAVMKAAFAIKIGSGKKSSSFGARCNQVVKSSTLSELQALPQVYKNQVSSLKNGAYSMVPTTTSKAVVNLFKDVIYGELFDHKGLWNALGVSVLTREQFHENFMSDNDYPDACPYCDLDSINSPGSRFVEHFLPKSKFPLLAVEPRNLFSACTACNGPQGKLGHVQGKVTAPYVKEIGKLVKFSFNDATSKLGISAHPSSADIDGYLRLLKLPDRYASVGAWKQFARRREAISESLGYRKPATRQELRDYVDTQQGGAVLTYAVGYWADMTIGANLP